MPPALLGQRPGGRRTRDLDDLFVGRAEELLEAVPAGRQVRLEPKLQKLLDHDRRLVLKMVSFI